MTIEIHIREGIALALVAAVWGCGLAPVHRAPAPRPQAAVEEVDGAPTAKAVGGGQLRSLQDHPTVQERVSFLLARNRPTLQVALTRSRDFLPIIEREFGEYGVPMELAYLPVVESRFRPDAIGATAVGLWQFTRATAQRYGLKVDRSIDERRDPAKSSRAAARYLRDLYEQFESWDLALAAYNAGPGRVRRALEQRPNASFFDLARQGLLPPVTRRYVPKVLAVSVIGPRPENYGVRLAHHGSSR